MKRKLMNPWLRVGGVIVPGWLVVQQQVNPGTKFLYALLAFHEHDEHADVARSKLTNEWGFGDKEHIEYLHEMENIGLIDDLKISTAAVSFDFLYHEWMEGIIEVDDEDLEQVSA